MGAMNRWVSLSGLLLALPAQAIDFSFNLGETRVDTVLNNSVTFGYAWRLQDPAADLVGKSNLNPAVCAGVFQACQGLHRDQSFPAEQLARAPGMASINFDDGNLNYARGDITQAPLKVSQDFRFLFGNYGIFFRGIGIYDYVNFHGFETNKPNLITADNADRVGTTGNNQTDNRYFDRVYGPGEPLRIERSGEEAREIGLRYDILDFNFFGSLPYADGERNLTFRIGRQTINWGQSTVAVVNSLSQAQPVNANALYRLGFGLLEELFVPMASVRASTEIFPGGTLEAFYQLEWQPVEIPTAGSFMSFADLGTDNQRDVISLHFGGSAEDPDFQTGGRQGNPLTAITPTTLTAVRNPDWDARDQGQFGVSLKYYSDAINNGTEFGFYAMNYHSKLPYISFFSTDASCARREGNAMGMDARNTTEFFRACPNLPITEVNGQGRLNLVTDIVALAAQRPLIATELGTDPVGLLSALVPIPGAPDADAVPFDTARLQIEYPEDRQMFGVDFTTTFGDYSLQGEVSYRPNLPLQVAVVDLAFAAFGPTLTRCHDPELGCAGASAGLGFYPDGSYGLYEDNDFVIDAEGTNPYTDTINLLVGAAPGSARSFPNFIIPYRGGTVGENPPNSYIQGWIPGKVAQYNLGATRVLGSSENWIGADQVILIYELAATHVLNMPEFDELQIEGPAFATTHASAGADGSGADRSRLACSTNPTCSLGPDGVRFNPFQAPRSAFADAFSWGYRVVGRISYESVLPGVSIQPLFIFLHDINGNAPGPAGNFVEGRKQFNFLLETRYEKSYAFTIAYNAFWGAGSNNVYRDRDNLGFFFKYQF